MSVTQSLGRESPKQASFYCKHAAKHQLLLHLLFSRATLRDDYVKHTQGILVILSDLSDSQERFLSNYAILQRCGAGGAGLGRGGGALTNFDSAVV